MVLAIAIVVVIASLSLSIYNSLLVHMVEILVTTMMRIAHVKHIEVTHVITIPRYSRFFKPLFSIFWTSIGIGATEAVFVLSLSIW